MSDDPDLDRLTDAFAALARSRQRVDAIIEQEIGNRLGTEPPGISELVAALENDSPLTDVERRILIDYLNIMALGARDPGKRDREADEPDA